MFGRQVPYGREHEMENEPYEMKMEKAEGLSWLQQPGWKGRGDCHPG